MNLFLRLVILVLILADIVIFLVIVILEIALVQVFVKLFELQSLPSEPVYSPRNEFFFDVFAELVVKLQPLFYIRSGVIIVSTGRFWRVKKVEERLGGYGLLDNPGLLRV